MYFGIILAFLIVAKTTNGAPMMTENDEPTENPVDLHYSCVHMNAELESKNQSPIILLHDAAVSLDQWGGFQQVLALKTGRRICSLDLRNHGDSPWNSRVTIKIMVKDLHHFLEQQEIRNATLIGHGLGGMVAANYALKYPNRVDSLIVEDMRPNGLNYVTRVVFERLWRYLERALRYSVGAKTLEEAKVQVGKFINEETQKSYGVQILDENTIKTLPLRCALIEKEPCEWKTNTKEMYKAIRNDEFFWDAYEDPKYSYGGPSLFIYGKKSPMKVEEDQENIDDLFTDNLLKGIKEASHNIHGVYKQFDDIVLQFLQKQ